jgi:hypothetical protein
MTVLTDTRKLVGSKLWLVLAVAGCLAISACGSDSDDGSFKPPTGTTVDVKGTVTAVSVPIEDADVAAFIAGTPDVPESMVMTDEFGEYIVTVLEGASASLSFGAENFATLNTIYRSYAANTTGLNIDLVAEEVADQYIEDAFPGMGFTLASKAWLAISFSDAAGNEIGDVAVVTEALVDGGGALDCDGIFSLGNVTQACDPARRGPMYLGYFDANNEIAIEAVGNSISFIATAPVRVGEITVLSISR